MDQALRPAITILIALAPAALALWWGRDIARHLDDPLLPERLMANRRRTAPASLVAFVFLPFVVATPKHLFWALPLLILTRMWASHRLRKTLHNETWSFATFVSFYVRLMVAVFGLWLLLMMTPTIATMAGRHDWIVAGALAVVLVAWHQYYSTIFRRVLCTKPLDDPEIVERFRRMLRDCGLPAVTLEQVQMGGGAFANGVALPSIHRPAVVLTDTLITGLDRDETVAILAHELSHLEFYNPRRLRRNSAIFYVLVTACALLAPLLRRFAPEALVAAPLFGCLLLIGIGLLRVRHRQKHETESDLRAMELTGNPDAVISALTKLHLFARLPRRWDSELERHTSHPSLARRIQAIRVAAGTAQTSIGESINFDAPDGSASVTFHDSHLDWRDKTSTVRSICYGDLRELRIHARASGKPRLIGVGSQPHRSDMRLQQADVARLQSILDIVDMRLASAGDAPKVPGHIAFFLSLITGFAAIAAGQLAVAVVAFLAIVRPAPQLVAACGVSAVTAAWLAWRDGSWMVMGTPTWVMATLLLAGVAMIGVAFANRHEAPPKWVPQLLACLALCAAMLWVVAGIRGGNALELHRRALEWPSIVIVTLGLAGACLFARSSRLRGAAVPVTLAAVCAGYLGSDAFAARFVNDPFLSAAPATIVTTVTGPPLTELSVELNVSKLWISRTGLFLAIQTWDTEQHSRIHAGRVSGPLTAFAADEAAFLDDGRLLLMSREAPQSVLRVVDLSAGNRETWSIRPSISWGALSVGRASGRWRVLGWASNQAVSAEGHIGESEFSQKRWPAPSGEVDDQEALAVSNGVALAIEKRPVEALPTSVWGWLLYLRATPRVDSRLLALHTHGFVELAASRIELDYARSAVIEGPAMCVSFDGRNSRFFEVNLPGPTGQSLVPLASVPGEILLEDSSDRGWVAGWWQHRPAVFAPARHQAILLAPTDGDRPYRLVVGETVLASVSSHLTHSRIRVYSLPPRPSER